MIKEEKQNVPKIVVGVLIIFLTTGHYYVHHFVEARNPVHSELPNIFAGLILYRRNAKSVATSIIITVVIIYVW